MVPSTDYDEFVMHGMSTKNVGQCLISRLDNMVFDDFNSFDTLLLHSNRKSNVIAQTGDLSLITPAI